MATNGTTTTLSSKITVRFGDAILQEGFTTVPNLVLNHYARLGISPAEMMFTIHIWQHWWTEQDPYPSLKKISEKMNVTRRQASNYTQQLKNKGFLIVRERYVEELGQVTSEYDFSPLIEAVINLTGSDTPTPMKNISGGGMKNISRAPLKQISYEKDEEKEYPEQEDIYLSNIRKAKSNEFDYVKLDGSTAKAAGRARLTHNEGGGPTQNRTTAKRQNIEKIEAHKNFAPAQKTKQQPAPADPQRQGGLTHIGQTVQSRLPIAPPTVDAAVARDAIERFIRDTAAKLHDEAPLKSSTTRAFNLYQRSGVDMGTFYNLMYDAEKEANRRSATIKKLTAQGFKNRMAYFFALLEDKLGLREKPLPNVSQSP